MLRAFRDQAGTSEPTVFTHYLYDAGGVRLKKITRNISGDPTVSVYIDGAFDHHYKVNASTGTRSNEHNEIHVMDDRIRIANLRIGTPFPGDNAPAVRYYLEDHLGNCSFTLETTGALFSREEYFPFGETSFGSFAKKRYRFCGKERDEESGLYYYGARYYAPWTCRFVSVDPLAGEYPFYTPYQYAGNQPVIAIDLDGLEPTFPATLQNFVTSFNQIFSETIRNKNTEFFGNSVGNNAFDMSKALVVRQYFQDQAGLRNYYKDIGYKDQDKLFGYNGGCTYDCMQNAVAAYAILTDDYDFRTLWFPDRGDDGLGESFREVMTRWAEKGNAGEEYQFKFGTVTKKGGFKVNSSYDRPDEMYFEDYRHISPSQAMYMASEGKSGAYYFGVALGGSFHSLIITMWVDTKGHASYWWNDQYTEYWGEEYDFGISGEKLDKKFLNFIRERYKDSKGNQGPYEYRPDPKLLDQIYRLDTYVRQIIPPNQEN